MGFDCNTRDSLLNRIDSAIGRGVLGDWEIQFLLNIRARIVRDGSPARLTQKQARKLDEVLARSQARVRWGGNVHRTRWRRRSLFGYLPYRARRDLTLLAILLFVIGAHQLYLRAASAVQQLAAPAVAVVNPGPAQPDVTATESPAAATTSLQSAQISGSIRIIDGDTVAVGAEHFRLVGLNTPETFEPRCAAELALGTRAKDRLRQLLASGHAELTKVACACPPGTEGTKHCNFGRSCAVLKVDGADVAMTLVGEGLAVPFHCGTFSCPPLPRPWCR